MTKTTLSGATALLARVVADPLYASLTVGGLSAASLAAAFAAEHLFSVLPCILCIYQRIPYAFAAFLGLAGAAFLARETKTRGGIGPRGAALARGLMLLCAMGFLINAGIAFFHSGVELHWWEGTDTCAVDPLVVKDPASARQALLKAPVVRCDAINFTFLGLTMANWNVANSLAFCAFAFAAFCARRRESLDRP